MKFKVLDARLLSFCGQRWRREVQDRAHLPAIVQEDSAIAGRCQSRKLLREKEEVNAVFLT